MAKAITLPGEGEIMDMMGLQILMLFMLFELSLGSSLQVN